jgi:hypothetical protein
MAADICDMAVTPPGIDVGRALRCSGRGPDDALECPTGDNQHRPTTAGKKDSTAVKTKLAVPLARVAWAILFALAWAQGLPAAKPEEVGLSSERLARITETLRHDVAQGTLPGRCAAEHAPWQGCLF